MVVIIIYSGFEVLKLDWFSCKVFEALELTLIYLVCGSTLWLRLLVEVA